MEKKSEVRKSRDIVPLSTIDTPLSTIDFLIHKHCIISFKIEFILHNTFFTCTVCCHTLLKSFVFRWQTLNFYIKCCTYFMCCLYNAGVAAACGHDQLII
jgi:hypothetical protein